MLFRIWLDVGDALTNLQYCTVQKALVSVVRAVACTVTISYYCSYCNRQICTVSCYTLHNMYLTNRPFVDGSCVYDNYKLEDIEITSVHHACSSFGISQKCSINDES